jgi:hypothetical protein
VHRKLSCDGFSFPRGIQEPLEPWVPFFILGGVDILEILDYKVLKGELVLLVLLELMDRKVYKGYWSNWTTRSNWRNLTIRYSSQGEIGPFSGQQGIRGETGATGPQDIQGGMEQLDQKVFKKQLDHKE